MLVVFQLAYCSTLYAKVKTCSGYWDSSKFVCCTNVENSQKIPYKVIAEKTIDLSNLMFPFCYGHFMLDSIFSLYKILKENYLLNEPINFFFPQNAFKDIPNANQIIDSIKQFLTIVFKPKKIISPSINSKVPIGFLNFIELPTKTFSFLTSYPDCVNYFQKIRSYGIQDNLTISIRPCKENLVLEFVQFVKQAYKINTSMVKNRILFTSRNSFDRSIKNESQLIKKLKNLNFDIHPIKFENMSIGEQIKEVVKAEYIIGIYGSNFTNACFMHKDAKAIIIWPQHAKYGWARKLCIVQGAFLATGVTLIEYDKPEHELDEYLPIAPLNPKYVFWDKNILKIKPDKLNLDDIDQMSYWDLDNFRHVNMYLDVDHFIKFLENNTTLKPTKNIF